MTKPFVFFLLLAAILQASGLRTNAQQQQSVRSCVITRFRYEPVTASERRIVFETTFCMGSSGTCPPFVGCDTLIRDDTLFLKAYYDIRGAWPAMFCNRKDTVRDRHNLTRINYINASCNVITYDSANSAIADTVDNAHDSTFLLRPAGLTGLRFDEAVSIFLNPVSGVLNIDVPAYSGALTISVIDIMGNTVLKTDRVANGHSLQMDLSGVRSGVYLVHLFADGRRLAVRRVIKVE